MTTANDEATLRVDGKVIVYDVERLSLEQEIWPYHVTPEEIVRAFVPQVSLRPARHTVPAEDAVPFQVLRLTPEEVVGLGFPYTLRLEVDRSDPQYTGEWYYEYSDWVYHVYLTEATLTVPQYVPPRSSRPTLLTVVSPMFDWSPDRAAKVLRAHVDFYSGVGFAGTVLYERGPYIAPLSQHPDTAPLLERHQLMLMLWDHSTSGTPLGKVHGVGVNPKTGEPFKGFEGNKYIQFDKQVMYSHAAVAFSGLNTYLFFVDMDDMLLMAPSPRHNPQLDLDAVATREHALRPSDMLEQLEACTAAHGLPGPASGAGFLVVRADQDTASTGQTNPCVKLDGHELARCLRFRVPSHFDRRYRLPGTPPRRPKVFALADDVLGLSFHEVYGFATDAQPEEPVRPVAVPDTCMYLAHISMSSLR